MKGILEGRRGAVLRAGWKVSVDELSAYLGCVLLMEGVFRAVMYEV